jgi:hypothetical protein
MRLGNFSPLSDNLRISFGSSKFLFLQHYNVVKPGRLEMGKPFAHHRSLMPERLRNVFLLGAFLPKSTCECSSQVIPAKPNNLSIFHCALKPRTRAAERPVFLLQKHGPMLRLSRANAYGAAMNLDAKSETCKGERAPMNLHSIVTESFVNGELQSREPYLSLLRRGGLLPCRVTERAGV